ncbi:hypothetical protein JY651_18760 [Pyxidicoccus parkwayensis]|uniref:Lipoprotein n=1 Tax=Pyxidicoccus parkwayensis TaxID=2813578 RepID=A0ABX7P8J1_9BACT|nr:hypothetical protein [Pyxidicoccus parkwaysis]QSQ26828.1 hypothetical protein JY651_18760 [Pyxidicoccus parkwaysis]
MLLIAACAGTPDRGTPGHYAFDSATSKCEQQPLLCARMVGEETVIPLARTMETVASTVRTGVAVLRIFEETTKAVVEKELTACAEQARSKVLLDHFDGGSPTPRECNEVVEESGSGRRITRAMQLGCLMHEVALACTREALRKRIPGRFSLEQRYRYDRATRTLALMSAEETRSLLRLRCGEELRGTLVPDVVIHSGNPLEAQAIYDFKFPCANSSELPLSRPYPQGHPYGGDTQETIYQEALGAEVWRVVPRWGVIR